MATPQSTTIPLSVEYRHLPTFPGYRIGNDGTVWTAWKQIGLGGGKGSRCEIRDRWRQVTVFLDPASRSIVLLRRSDKKRVTCRVHVLVALAFLGPKPPGKEVAHENGKPTDNRVENLAYKTHSENLRDRVRHGTDDRGEKSPLAKLTDSLVRQMKAEYVRGKVGYSTLGKKYGVCPRTVARIIAGVAWPHISGSN